MCQINWMCRHLYKMPMLQVQFYFGFSISKMNNLTWQSACSCLYYFFVTKAPATVAARVARPATFLNRGPSPPLPEQLFVLFIQQPRLQPHILQTVIFFPPWFLLGHLGQSRTDGVSKSCGPRLSTESTYHWPILVFMPPSVQREFKGLTELF